LYTFAEDNALSAGYFLLSIGNRVFVDEGSLVGSIGVLYLNIKIGEITKKLGFEPRKFASNKYICYLCRNLFLGYTGLNDVVDPHMDNTIKPQFGLMRQ
jgi:hypothetical protein